jgi:hypothetical protein
MYEVKANVGQPLLQVVDRSSPATQAPGSIWKQGGVLNISRNSPPNAYTSGAEIAINTVGTVEVLSNLTVGGNTQFLGNAVIGGANSNWLARITATAAQSLTNNTSTKITFNTASGTPDIDSYDPQGWFDNANDRIVIGQDGFYNITANVGFATNTTSRRLVQIFVNGSDRGSVNVTAAAAGTTLLTVSTNVYLVATDYVEVHALQQSGGALNTVSVTGVYPVLSVGRIGA